MVAHRLWEPGVPSSNLGCPTMINSDRVLVCGSRDWDDQDIIWTMLDGLFAHILSSIDWVPDPGTITIIDGAARGADTMAYKWAECMIEQGLGQVVFSERYPADWDQHGRAAGPIRNKQMLVEGKPTLVLAFSDDLSVSRGTANMVKQSRAAGVPVYVIGR